MVLGACAAGSPSSAVELINEAHGVLLRACADGAGRHFQGLSQAARNLKQLRTRQRRWLAHIDIAFNMLRHVTKPLLDEFIREVDASLTDPNVIGIAPKMAGSASPSPAVPMEAVGVQATVEVLDVGCSPWEPLVVSEADNAAKEKAAADQAAADKAAKEDPTFEVRAALGTPLAHASADPLWDDYDPWRSSYGDHKAAAEHVLQCGSCTNPIIPGTQSRVPGICTACQVRYEALYRPSWRSSGWSSSSRSSWSWGRGKKGR